MERMKVSEESFSLKKDLWLDPRGGGTRGRYKQQQLKDSQVLG